MSDSLQVSIDVIRFLLDMGHSDGRYDRSEVGNVERKSFFIVDINDMEVESDDLFVIFELLFLVVLETLGEDRQGRPQQHSFQPNHLCLAITVDTVKHSFLVMSSHQLTTLYICLRGTVLE